jgi:hypothetical protein
VDEGHSLKNVGTATHKAVRDFAAGQHLQILTGTPVSQPGDAYGYVRLKTPSVYSSEAQFMNLHVEEKDFFGNVTKWQNLDLMNKNLMLQASRRLSKEVLKHLKTYNKVGGRHYANANENNLEMYARKVALLQVLKTLIDNIPQSTNCEKIVFCYLQSLYEVTL